MTEPLESVLFLLNPHNGKVVLASYFVPDNYHYDSNVDKSGFSRPKVSFNTNARIIGMSKFIAAAIFSFKKHDGYWYHVFPFVDFLSIDGFHYAGKIRLSDVVTSSIFPDVPMYGVVVYKEESLQIHEYFRKFLAGEPFDGGQFVRKVQRYL